LKELDILDNEEHVLRIKQQIYENLSMHGIELACNVRTSRVSDREAESYGLIPVQSKEEHLHPVNRQPRPERFFRFSIKIFSDQNIYIHAFTPGKILTNPSSSVNDFMWISNIGSKKVLSFTEFLKEHKRVSKKY